MPIVVVYFSANGMEGPMRRDPCRPDRMEQMGQMGQQPMWNETSCEMVGCEWQNDTCLEPGKCESEISLPTDPYPNSVIKAFFCFSARTAFYCLFTTINLISKSFGFVSAIKA